MLTLCHGFVGSFEITFEDSWTLDGWSIYEEHSRLINSVSPGSSNSFYWTRSLKTPFESRLLSSVNVREFSIWNQI